MATSGVTTGVDVVSQIVRDALITLGELAANEEPSASDLNLGYRTLNWMLKDWQSDGVNLWRQQWADIAWPAATAEGDVSPDINDILTLAYIAPGADYERQLTRWEVGEYMGLPNKITSGAPTIYCVTEGLEGLRVRLWPVPSDATTLKASINRIIQDVTAGTETLDVPAKYTRTVMMNLAAALVPAFGKATDPNAVIIIREAAKLYLIARAADRPASYFLGSARYG